MRISNSSVDLLSHNGLTMVDENSATDPYFEEISIDQDISGHNNGINDSNTLIQDTESNILTFTNINSNIVTKKSLTQLNLFGEVSVNQGEKKMGQRVHQKRWHHCEGTHKV